MLTSLDWYIQPDPGEIMFYSYFPEMQQAPDGMYSGTSFSRMIPASEPSPGQWYCLEFELKANTPGLHDGHQRMWINDQFKAAPTGLTVQ